MTTSTQLEVENVIYYPENPYSPDTWKKIHARQNSKKKKPLMQNEVIFIQKIN